MADKRPFFKVDVGYFDNPKVQAIIDDNPRAVLLHLRSIAYARQHLTDGIVPRRVVARGIAASNADCIAACNAGLLFDVGDGNFEVHDYAEHQQTADEVKAVSLARTAAARARWDARSNARGTARSNAGSNAEKRREDITSELRPDIIELLDHLDRRIAENGAKKPGRTKKNLDAARLLIDRDNHPADEVRLIIDWATGHDFWRSNILSMSKLREKYDQLRLQAGPAATHDDSWDRYRYDPDTLEGA